MLLQRIELEGFLSHRGRQLDNGATVPVEIDFRASPLWLIHGPNGAGKSAIFDAITFALFKRHRGGGQNFEQLIHDRADVAKIGLEIALNGDAYLIQRTITRTKGSARVWGIVRRQVGDVWQAIPDTTNAVEVWVQRNLRMSYETFVSAVVLRQGEADVFLKAKPGERRERLMELLDLQFYEDLGDRATRRRSEWLRLKKQGDDELRQLAVVTDEDLEGERARLETVRNAVQSAQEQHEGKQVELRDAQNSAKFLEEIATAVDQQQADAELVKQAVAIRTRTSRYNALGRILPQLDQVWAARGRVTTEFVRIADTERKINSLEEAQRLARAKLESGRITVELAATELQQAEAVARDARDRLTKIKAQIAQLEQIERLEKTISDAQATLMPYRTVLDQAEAINQNHQRHETLREALPLVRTLAAAEQELSDAQAQEETAQAALAVACNADDMARVEERRCSELLQSATTALDQTRGNYERLVRQIAPLHDKLERREQIADDEACPVCGSRLDTEGTRERLERERLHWHTELGELESQEKQFEQTMAEQQAAKADGSAALEQATSAARKAAGVLVGVERDNDNAVKWLQRAKTVAEVARIKTDGWAKDVFRLPALEEEWISLSSASIAWHKLGEARTAERAVAAKVETCNGELAHLPQWSVEERARLRADEQAIAKAIEDADHDEAIAQESAKKASNEINRLTKRQYDAEGDLRQARDELGGLRERKEEVEQELEGYLTRLPDQWKQHPACADAGARQALCDDYDALKDAPTAEEALNAAEQRSLPLQGEIKRLQKQLDLIPVEHRRHVAEVEVERTEIETALITVRNEFSAASKRLTQLEMQKQQRDACVAKRDEAERELGYYTQLCQAFGKTGLQARIIREAQEAIKFHANMTLGRLSDGQWRIELKEADNGAGLEILAADLRQPDVPLRQFEYISGGERFRVAISVAVAIGQATTGGRPVDTLVIDEGFGSLDEVNRELLVTELGRLSEEVLNGGRVIVVSHQQDVVDQFGSRYQLSRDADGNVLVEYNPDH